MCIDSLRGEGMAPTGFWLNPNIHPWKEYQARKNALMEYARGIGLKLVMEGTYGLRPFIKAVYPDFDARCGTCYSMRLEETARHAAENGYDSFTTTLLISPYQKHEMICRVAQKAADTYRIPFLYRDFRPMFRDGQQRARDMGLYMQKYCGCIFSEEDRYRKQKR